MNFRRASSLTALSVLAWTASAGRHVLAEETPYLSAPQGEDKLSGLAALDDKDIRKEADALQRKANLIKAAADKKYVESARLRQQAGTYRAAADANMQAVQARAAATQGTNELLGTVFSMLGSVSPVQTPSQSMTMGLTGKLLDTSNSMDANTAAQAQGHAGQQAMEAEKNAGPLEMRAQTVEEDGNRLMAAYNRIQSLANAKLLLLASEDLRRAILQDRESLASVKKQLP